MFEGFRNLKSLDLNKVKMTQDDFENLISSSPLLEKLILNELDGFKQINIHGPNLKFFYFSGDFEDISFHNTFKISKLIVCLYPGHIQDRLHECSSNLLQFFVHLPNIQSLEIRHFFLKYLATGVVPLNLPTPCINLRSLCLRINFNDWKEISAALCLLKSSPNLQKLHIIAAADLTSVLTLASCWENIFLEPTIPIHVRHVRIFGISGFKYELDFVRFLLLYSPMLEKMIVRSHVNVKPKLMAELTQFKSKVIYEEYNFP
ncbi:hypothetical protein P8452_00526 [Trifolium repens]|nr:hypothetical protein P8452_00526 [Trifolium repens]